MKPAKQQPPEHRTWVEIGSGYSGVGYLLGECICGWGSDPCLNRDAVEHEIDKHLASAQQPDKETTNRGSTDGDP